MKTARSTSFPGMSFSNEPECKRGAAFGKLGTQEKCFRAAFGKLGTREKRLRAAFRKLGTQEKCFRATFRKPGASKKLFCAAFRKLRVSKKLFCAAFRKPRVTKKLFRVAYGKLGMPRKRCFSRCLRHGPGKRGKSENCLESPSCSGKIIGVVRFLRVGDIWLASDVSLSRRGSRDVEFRSVLQEPF